MKEEGENRWEIKDKERGDEDKGKQRHKEADKRGKEKGEFEKR